MTTGTDASLRDDFARDNLPLREQWPDLLLDGLHYPERLNCVTELLDQQISAGNGARPCLRSPTETWTYADLAARVNRIANVLTRQLGMIPGNRVLLRAPNTPMMVAAYLAVIKAGGIAVASMPLLRAKELATILAKARIALALCDHRLTADLRTARRTYGDLRIVSMGGTEPDDLLAMMADEADTFTACATRADDICLIAFTSGTTGEPKGTMHFHRDMLAICDTYGAQVLRARPDDVFIASPPIAFTFGLGAAVLFPLRVGAASILLEQASPRPLLEAIRTMRPTVCFTAPTAYRAMLGMMQPSDVASLRLCVSAGEPLPKPTWDAWHAATGMQIMDGIGATEMLHIFIAAPMERIRPGARGKADRRRRKRPAARQHGAPGCAWSDWMSLSCRRATDPICAERLEHHRRHLPSGRRRSFLVSGALRRHDPVVGLQHSWSGSRGGVADPSSGCGMRRGGRTGCGPRYDCESLCRVA
jgi:2-aminobenzoate-CoA ligase